VFGKAQIPVRREKTNGFALTGVNRGVGQIRTWILAALAQLGIQPNDLPPDLF
jgi:hypothetical protein